MNYSHLALSFLFNHLANLGISFNEFYTIHIDSYDKGFALKGDPLRIRLQGSFDSDLVLKINKLSELDKLMVNPSSGYVEGQFVLIVDADFSFLLEFVLT